MITSLSWEAFESKVLYCETVGCSGCEIQHYIVEEACVEFFMAGGAHYCFTSMNVEFTRWLYQGLVEMYKKQKVKFI